MSGSAPQEINAPFLEALVEGFLIEMVQDVLTEADPSLQVSGLSGRGEGEVALGETAGVTTGESQQSLVKRKTWGQFSLAAIQVHINQVELGICHTAHQNVLLTQLAVCSTNSLLQLSHNAPRLSWFASVKLTKEPNQNKC